MNEEKKSLKDLLESFNRVPTPLREQCISAAIVSHAESQDSSGYSPSSALLLKQVEIVAACSGKPSPWKNRVVTQLYDGYVKSSSSELLEGNDNKKTPPEMSAQLPAGTVKRNIENSVPMEWKQETASTPTTASKNASLPKLLYTMFGTSIDAGRGLCLKRWPS